MYSGNSGGARRVTRNIPASTMGTGPKADAGTRGPASKAHHGTHAVHKTAVGGAEAVPPDTRPVLAQGWPLGGGAGRPPSGKKNACAAPTGHHAPGPLARGGPRPPPPPLAPFRALDLAFDVGPRERLGVEARAL